MNPVPFILLAISLPLLLGGCGEEPVAVTSSLSDLGSPEQQSQ